jgi:eukaryotic-like serine/threonine-protein kinase
MKTIRFCSSCGSPVPADAPDGLCPRCLINSRVTGSAGAAPEQTPALASPLPKTGEMFGDYRILRLLGQGGMGHVYEAEHAGNGRHLAIKVMNQALASEQDRKRFLREGRLAASVNHPNVVYIYGSEEIGGAPVIAMELVQSGTLKDQLKREGSLTPAQAVEAALQIIAGLEAAGKAGVLHRDIKPANCFVDVNGIVKVGDFGLSISTLARKESLITAAGSVLGTPAYASPEQLRGQPLDVASDIYSTGATLYHLLTGKIPFDEQDFVKLITEVLDVQPASPNSVRPEIPAELSRVVMRCLAKDRKARYQTFDQLRAALLPFGSAPATPARPGRRLLAGLMDEVIAFGPGILFLGYWSLDPSENMMRERTFNSVLAWLGFTFWYVMYFAMLEGRTGAGVGKLICGLRVVGTCREAPGFWRALFRTMIYVIPDQLPYFLVMAFMSLEKMNAASSSGAWLLPDQTWFITPFILFVSMRKRNGYAAIHDLLTGTRVIVAPKLQARPALSLCTNTAESPCSSVEVATAFGPYQVQSCLWKREDEELWGASDPVLQRKIWIHVRSDNTAPLSKFQRELNRPARLHWLNSGKADGQIWDAYQALEGAAFLTVPDGARNWTSVRFWMLDIAQEISASLKGGLPLPTLAFDRIWIDANSHLVLLDFPCPGLSEERAPSVAFALNGVRDMQQFLTAFAWECLGNFMAGQPAKKTLGAENSDGFRNIVPLHAQSFLVSLAEGNFVEPEFIVGNLLSLVSKPGSISRSWRMASLAFAPVVVLGLAILICAMVYFEQFRVDREWHKLHPNLPPLGAVADVYDLQVGRNDKDVQKDLELTRLYVKQHFGSLLTNEVLWTNGPLAETLGAKQLQGLREAVSNAPPATPSQTAEADSLVAPRIRAWRMSAVGMLLFGFVLCGVAAYSLVELLGGIIFGQSPVLRLFGLALLDKRGWPAGRGRAFLRWVVIWMPATVVGLPVASLAIARIGMNQVLIVSDAMSKSVSVATVLGILITAVAFLGFVTYAIWRPERSFADWLAGTRLAPV